jgi:DNA-binding PadR family transcriptional regulator
MKRIAVTQLALLKWAKTQKKGFLVDDAMAQFKSPRQSTAVRLAEALEKRWLSRKAEPGDGAARRHRYWLTAGGKKMLAKKWGGKGRYRVLA